MPIQRSRRRRWTVQGRIVYDRPKHRWTLSDLDRVRKYVERDAQLADQDGLADQVYQKLKDVQANMLTDIFVQIGIKDAAEAGRKAQDWLQSGIQSIFNALGIDTRPLDQAISDLLNNIGAVINGKGVISKEERPNGE